MDGFAILALIVVLAGWGLNARWFDSVFRPPLRTAKIVAIALTLLVAVFIPAGWAGVVVVSGAMLLEPVIFGRAPDDEL